MDLMDRPHTSNGENRLLQMMIDVGIHVELARQDRAYDNASDAHQKLFDGYVPLLRQGYKEALPWWEGTVRSAGRSGKIDEESLEEAYDARMAGPASDPRIVWIVRLIWLKCCKINESEPFHAIRPEYLMVRWLIDAGENELVRLLACMPYWPIGLNADGNWC